ncbi:MAG TPA: hypothetical protein VGA31_10670 [Thermoanaerobaculia bacterium]
MTDERRRPATAEQGERVERHPGTKGQPHERGTSRESPEKQPEAELEPETEPDHQP